MLETEKADYEVARLEMNIAANNARESLSKLIQFDIPEMKSPEAIKAERDTKELQIKNEVTTSWEKVYDKLTKDVSDIKVIDSESKESLVSFKMNEKELAEFRSKVNESILNHSIQTGTAVQPTPEVIESIVKGYQTEYIANNIEKIIKSTIEDVRTKIKEEEINKRHNPRPLNDIQPPVTLTDEQQESKKVNDRVLSYL
jgi:hypothetical protein